MGPVLVVIAIAAVLALTREPPPPPPKAEAPDRVVLLPEPDGRVGAVTVRSTSGERVLTKAFEGAAVGAKGDIVASVEDESAVRARFAQVLGAIPPRPVSYLLYFSTGDELTAESKGQLDAIKAEFARRPAPEIHVIGHTDRVGSVESNDMLSLKRAEAVRKMLVDAGIRADAIEASGRGERELLVPTADEVIEPGNRRVEINVR
jgi:outer membrane protein OmpA-like peptidoglycan-associated protein